MTVILSPFAKLLLLFYNVTGSYALALILFGLCVRLILFPLFLKGRKSMLAMNGLAEKQKVLQQKYMRDRERYSIELQKLYEEEGVKPSGGCLWSFLPMPFLMVLYLVIRRPLTYLMGMNEDIFNSVSNLLYGEVLDFKNQQLQMAQDVFLNHDRIVSSIPELANMPNIDFSFLGANLSATPSFFFWRAEDIGPAFVLWLIPVVSAVMSAVTTIVSNRINARVMGTSRPMDQSMRMTMIMMPLISLWIGFTLPGALAIYWVANSVFAILQEFLNIPFLRKYQKQLEEDKIKRKEEEKERVKQEKKAQAEAKKKAQEEMRRIQMERKVNKSLAAASRVGMRTYARGRSYDPDRYPSFPYREPGEIAKEQDEERARLAAAKGGKGGKGAAQAAAPAPAPEQTEKNESPERPADQPMTTAELEAQALEAVQGQQEDEE